MRHLTALGGLVVTLAGALVAVPAGPAFADPAIQPPAGKVGAEIVTVEGNACTVGGLRAALTADNTGLVVNHLPITARVSPGSTATARLSCQLAVRLRPPQGYTYRVTDVAVQGTAHLKPGANAVLKITETLPTAEPDALLKRAFAGPLDQPWDAVSEERTASDAAPAFMPCSGQRPVTFALDLRVSAGASDVAGAGGSVFSVGYQDLPRPDPGIRFRLDWRTCPVAGV